MTAPFDVHLFAISDSPEIWSGMLSRPSVLHLIKDPNTESFLAIVHFPKNMSFNRTCKKIKAIPDLAEKIANALHIAAKSRIKADGKYQLVRVLLRFDDVYDKEPSCIGFLAPNKYQQIKTSYALRKQINEHIWTVMNQDGQPGYSISRAVLLLDSKDMQAHQQELSIRC